VATGSNEGRARRMPNTAPNAARSANAPYRDAVSLEPRAC